MKKMSKLFENAIQSIQVGVEDYQANDHRRGSSAVRNFYAGVLLLAKEVLVRAAPNANTDDIIAERYKPMPDGKGGVIFQSASRKTIDFSTIGSRFRDFGLTINRAALDDLARIRNEVEHHFTSHPKQVLREAIAKAFPVVVDLLRLAGEEPHVVLGDAWEVMLNVKEVYEQELKICRSSFDSVKWHSGVLSEAAFNCPYCHSDLVAQHDANNKDCQSVNATCRSCAAEITAETLVEHTLAVHFEAEAYIAATDGGEDPLGICAECGLETYIIDGDEVGCAWCGTVLGSCARCATSLTPTSVSADRSTLCSYCDNVMSKDD